MWTVIVWDIRDADKAEPASQLGSFSSEKGAKIALREYLEGEHGPYIIKFEIVKEN